MKITIFPGKYHQNGGFSRAMLVYRSAHGFGKIGDCVPKMPLVRFIRKINPGSPTKNEQIDDHSSFWYIFYPVGNQHIPSQGTFEDDFPFSKVGYVSFLEGTVIFCFRRKKQKIKGWEPPFQPVEFALQPFLSPKKLAVGNGWILQINQVHLWGSTKFTGCVNKLPKMLAASPGRWQVSFVNALGPKWKKTPWKLNKTAPKMGAFQEEILSSNHNFCLVFVLEYLPKRWTSTSSICFFCPSKISGPKMPKEGSSIQQKNVPGDDSTPKNSSKTSPIFGEFQGTQQKPLEKRHGNAQNPKPKWDGLQKCALENDGFAKSWDDWNTQH